MDLLHAETYLRYLKEPAQFRKEAEFQHSRNPDTTILVHEVQRAPELLNEVHSLLESRRCPFILTGSSARKLKRGGANLLAGRAAVCHLHPLTSQELGPRFDLDEVLRHGTLPPVVNAASQEEKRDILTAYTTMYLKEEIQAEGIARNIAGFSRFLDVAADQSGEVINYSSIARDVSLPARTVQNYFEILEYTLLAFKLEAFTMGARKRLALHPKTYLFDIGVLNALNRHLSNAIEPTRRGKLFEHLVVLETLRLLSYSGSEARAFYWRTSHGAEVDLIIEKNRKIFAAVEIKAKTSPGTAALSGLRAFREDHPHAHCLLVCEAPNPYELEFATVLPWRKYFEWLWKELAGRR